MYDLGRDQARSMSAAWLVGWDGERVGRDKSEKHDRVRGAKGWSPDLGSWSKPEEKEKEIFTFPFWRPPVSVDSLGNQT